MKALLQFLASSAVLLVSLALFAPPVSQGQTGVWTWHNDNWRTGGLAQPFQVILREAAPSLSLRTLQRQGGEFDFQCPYTCSRNNLSTRRAALDWTAGGGCPHITLYAHGTVVVSACA